MREIKLKVDGYMKFILTLIAIALLGLLFKPFLIPQEARASREVTDVNIAKIDGWSVSSSIGSPIQVKIVK